MYIKKRNSDVMIKQPTLEKLLSGYGVDFSKFTSQQILKDGVYKDIDDTLDYLINTLKVKPSSIEKCPSILYKNVGAIKDNVKFLKEAQVDFSKIEDSLYVLSTDQDSLQDTYDYVLVGYGLEIINNLPTILAVPKTRIVGIEDLKLPLKGEDIIKLAIGRNSISEISSIFRSDEYKKFPHLFTPNAIVRMDLQEVQKILESKEFKEHEDLFSPTSISRLTYLEVKQIFGSKEYKEHSELFTANTLAFTSFSDVQDMLNSEEYKKYPYLFTSAVLSYSTFDEIKEMLNSPEFHDYPDLFTPVTLAYAKLNDIKTVVASKEFKEHPELFTAVSLSFARFSDIQRAIDSDAFKNHPELFSTSTFAYASLEQVEDVIDSEEYKMYPKFFTAYTVARRTLDEMKDMLNSTEFQSHSELFTSQVFAVADFDEVKKILNSKELDLYPHLFSSTTLAYGKYNRIKAIFDSDEFKNNPKLFTSQTLAHGKIEEIQVLMNYPYWSDERYKHLLTSTVVAGGKAMIKKIPLMFKIAEYYHIDDALVVGYLLKSPSQVYALINYIIGAGLNLVEDGKVNAMFNYMPGYLKKHFNIDLKALVRKYPIDASIFDEKIEEVRMIS